MKDVLKFLCGYAMTSLTSDYVGHLAYFATPEFDFLNDDI